MLSIQELDLMSQLDIEQISKDSLVDIRDVKIDTSLPITERMESYLNQIQNPYCFRCGDVKVRVRFEQNGMDLRSRFVNHLMNQKTA